MDSMEAQMSLFKRHSLSCIIGIINKVKGVQIGDFSHPVSSSESKMSVGIVKYRKEFLFIFKEAHVIINIADDLIRLHRAGLWGAL